MADSLFNRFNRPAPIATPAKEVQGDGSSGTRNAAPATGAQQIRELEILSAIDRVPALPVVVTRVLALVGNQGTAAAALEELIAQDMVIAGKLLKLVNSPFYGRSQKVSSLNQAVQIVGFQSLKSLVLAASTSSMMGADLTSYGFAPGGLWKNSIGTAALARAVGIKTGVGRDAAEDWFVAGLLRDVGMLVTGPFLARARADLRKVDGGEPDLLKRERNAIGYDHCWTGERLAEKWSLPEELKICMGKHHRIPADAPPALIRKLAGLRLAERLGYAAGIGVVPGHPFDSQIDATLLQAAGIDPSMLQALIGEVPAIVATSDLNL